MSSAEIFLRQSRYYLTEEYLAKLRHCINAVPEGAIWQRANDSSNSIGNLLLHLAGNVRQWIVGGVGGKPVERDRPAEFAARDGPDGKALLENLESAVREADSVLASLSTDDLEKPCTIQARETNVLAAIYHVVEHFAMHTGQIVLMTKTLAPGAIHFYDDSSWKATPTWGGKEGMR